MASVSLAHAKPLLGVTLGLGAAATILSASGLIPKFGPGRAVFFAFKPSFSTFTDRPKKCSVRVNEATDLLSYLSNVSDGQYIIATGGKDVGKSCLIQSALRHQFGVVNIEVKYFKIHLPSH